MSEMDFLYEVDDVLTGEECNKYRAMFDKGSGYDVEHIDGLVRKYDRIVMVDSELAARLYEQILKRGLLSKKLQKRAVGLNNHFRLSKYVPGQFFRIHKDGFNVIDGTMSYATLNIFLNDDFKGGETAFYEKDARTERIVVSPKPGRAAFFYSQQYHEGRKIISGEKYLLRTDLMIKRD